MSKITRRTVIHSGLLVASAIPFVPAGFTETAKAIESAGRVFHVFAFQWKPGVTDAQKKKAAEEIAALQGVIPGLLETHVGQNISPRGKGYTFGGIMRFKDRASLDAYPQQPAHQALLVWLMPLIDAIELDLSA